MKIKSFGRFDECKPICVFAANNYPFECFESDKVQVV